MPFDTIVPGTEVVGSDGLVVGTVAAVEGERLRLADGGAINADLVMSVDDKVRLREPAAQVMRAAAGS